jgi:hypothetical protein
MRRALLSMVVVAMVGCGGVGSTDGIAASAQPLACPADLGPAASREARLAAFDRLTGVKWTGTGCNSGANQPPTCNTLELRRDGSYALRAVSDYVERDDAGRWNFSIDDQGGGVLCLDGARSSPSRRDDPRNLPSALSFRLSATQLDAGLLAFRAGEALVSTGEVDALAPVALPEGWSRVVTTGAWRKTNDFDRFMLPDEVTFEKTGRFTARYRGGACTHGGRISWDKSYLVPLSDPNTCDERGGRTASIGASNEVPAFVADLMVFYASSYRPDANAGATQTRVFFFDPYSDSLRVRGEMDGPLRAGQPTTVRLTYENLVDRPRDLKSFKVTAQGLVPTNDGFTARDAAVSLVSRDYTERIAARGAFRDSVTITPPAPGRISLVLALEYADDRQPWKGSRGFIVDIP